MNNKLPGRKIYNDVVDEAYELEDAEEVIEEKALKNQLMDGEVEVSDDSQNYVHSPQNEPENEEGQEQDSEEDQEQDIDQENSEHESGLDHLNDE